MKISKTKPEGVPFTAIWSTETGRVFSRSFSFYRESLCWYSTKDNGERPISDYNWLFKNSQGLKVVYIYDFENPEELIDILIDNKYTKYYL